MKDLYELFNGMELDEETLEVMDDLEKQRWKKRLRKEIRKPAQTGRKIALSAGCLGIAAGLVLLLSDSEVLAVAKQAVEETYKSIAVWVAGTPEDNDYVQEIYGKAEANGREITIVDMIADQDLLQISYRDQDLSIENFEQGGYVGSKSSKEQEKTTTNFFLEAELLANGKTVGEGDVSSIQLSSDTNAIDGSFCIYTGDYGVDLSQVRDAELILRQKFTEGEEWHFSLNLEKRNLKDTTKTQKLSQKFEIEDGRTVSVYQYAENEGARKLYVKVEKPEDWDSEKWLGPLVFPGITDQKQKVKFEEAAGDIYLLNRNINSNTKSITVTPEIIPTGEPGTVVPEEGIPVGESFTIEVNK